MRPLFQQENFFVRIHHELPGKGKSGNTGAQDDYIVFVRQSCGTHNDQT